VFIFDACHLGALALQPAEALASAPAAFTTGWRGRWWRRWRRRPHSREHSSRTLLARVRRWGCWWRWADQLPKRLSVGAVSTGHTPSRTCPCSGLREGTLCKERLATRARTKWSVVAERRRHHPRLTHLARESLHRNERTPAKNKNQLSTNQHIFIFHQWPPSAEGCFSESGRPSLRSAARWVQKSR
jgi:hypothetical protein